MSRFKHINLSTKFIGVIFILFSLSSNSCGSFLQLGYNPRISGTKPLGLLTPTSRSELYKHYALAQQVKFHVDMENKSHQAAIQTYVQSIENLENALGDKGLTTTLSNSSENMKSLFHGNPSAQEAWYKVEVFYTCLHHVMDSTSKGEAWLKAREGPVTSAAKSSYKD